MTAEEILKQLKSLGQESYKKVLLKHGIQEPIYGVKIEELKKINKKIKNGHELSLQLYDTGIYDAMYLAGLVAEPAKMSVKELQHWADKANAPVLSEYTVAWVAAESPHAMKMAQEWIKSKDERVASSGWAALANIVSMKEDSELDISLLKKLLKHVKDNINKVPNRVKAVMNMFVISVGSYVKELNELAKQTGHEIGKVKVDVGDTACKIPFSPDYIAKVEAKNGVGKKKKSARCL